MEVFYRELEARGPRYQVLDHRLVQQRALSARQVGDEGGGGSGASGFRGCEWRWRINTCAARVYLDCVLSMSRMFLPKIWDEEVAIAGTRAKLWSSAVRVVAGVVTITVGVIGCALRARRV